MRAASAHIAELNAGLLRHQFRPPCGHASLSTLVADAYCARLVSTHRTLLPVAVPVGRAGASTTPRDRGGKAADEVKGAEVGIAEQLQTHGSRLSVVRR